MGLLLLLAGCALDPKVPSDITSQSSAMLTPSVPESLSAESGYKDKVVLKWHEASNADKYVIERRLKGESDFQIVDIVKSNVTELEVMQREDSEAEYRITAVAFYDGKTLSSKAASVKAATAGTPYFYVYVNKTELKAFCSDARASYYNSDLKLTVLKGSEEAVIFDTASGDMLTGGTFSADIVDLGLSMGQTYSFTLLSVTDKGFERECTESFMIAEYAEPSPVTDLTASKGEYTDRIEVKWNTPALAVGLENFTNAFIVERAEDTESPVFEAIYNETAGDSGAITKDGENTIYFDTTAETGKEYLYRIINCYRDSKGNYIKQTDGNYQISLSAYTVKPLERGMITSFISSGASGSVEFAFDYADAVSDKISFKLDKKTWKRSTAANSNNESDIEFTGSEGHYTFQEQLSIEDEEDLVTFEFTLNLYFEGTKLYSIPLITEDGSTIKLGDDSPASVYIESLSASDNLHKAVKLSWLEKEGLGSVSYTLYVNGTEYKGGFNSLVEKGAAIDGLIPCSAEIESSDSRNSFRLALCGKTAEDKTVNYSTVDLVYGAFISTPTGFAASQRTSTEAITLTWDASSDEAIRYQIGYRDSDTDYTIIDVPADANGSYRFVPAEKGTADAGKLYDMSVRSYNVNQSANEAEKYTPWCGSETGALFGPQGQSVSASDAADPMGIAITWTRVPGAASYSVYRGSQLLESGITGLSCTDSTIKDIEPTSENKYPLSAEYEYRVVAVPASSIECEDVSAYSVGIADNGSLFAPPENIKATKATSLDSITVTWEPAANAESYYVFMYRMNDGVRVDVSSAVVSECSITVKEDISSPLYFNVRSHSDSLDMTSLEQNSFGSNGGEADNFGYVLSPVTGVTLSENNGSRTFSFPKILGATGYSVTVNGITKNVSALNLQPGESDGMIALSADGETVTLTVADATYNADNTSYSVNAVNNLLVTDTTTIDSKVVLDALEVTKGLCTLMQSAFSGANASYGGDWWNGSMASAPTVRSYTGCAGVVVKSIGGSFWGDTQKAGSFKATDAPLSVAGRSFTVTSSDLPLWAKDEGSAGYLGTDPLEKVDPGTFSFAGSSALGYSSISAEIVNTLNVIDKTGLFKITLDGVTVDIDYSSSRVSAIKNW
jgi:hypothetical protein